MQPPAVDLEAVFGVWAELPVWAGVAAAVVGGAYLFFGRRLFRVLVVAGGAAAGYVLGRWIGVELGFPPQWTGLVVALVAGAAAWPLWQVAIFLMGAVPTALVVGEIVRPEHGASVQLYLALASGFVLGGVAAVLLAKMMSVVLTAGLGAYLVFVGVVAAGHDALPFLEKVAGLPLVAGAVMGLLLVAGIVAQIAQPPPEVVERRKAEKAGSKADEKARAESERNYQRYLGG